MPTTIETAVRIARRGDADSPTAVIFANELARDGVRVNLDGMDFTNYLQNPVVLYAHDHMGRTESGGLPVARTTSLERTDDGSLVAAFEWLPGDDFVARVRNAWDMGFLRGASIGWRAEEVDRDSDGVPVVTRSELVEWSLVSVPADPSAITRVRGFLESLAGNDEWREARRMVTRRDYGTEIDRVERTLAEVNNYARERARIGEEELARLRADVEKALLAMREQRRGLVMGGGDDGMLRIPSGRFAGYSPLDLSIMRSLATTHEGDPDATYAGDWVASLAEAAEDFAAAVTPDAVDRHFSDMERRLRSFYVPAESMGARDAAMQFREVISPQLQHLRADAMRAATRALDSTTAGAGAELVPRLERAELWYDVNLQTLIAGLVPTFPMPSQPFDIPTQLGAVNFYPGVENTPTTDTTPATAKVTLTAYELAARVPFSFSLDEDNVLPSLVGEIRSSLTRNTAEVLDDCILNADSTAANNINHDGATQSVSAAGAHTLLGYDGLLHLPLVDNTGASINVNAALTNGDFTKLRKLMGKYSVRPSECAWVTDVDTYLGLQGLDDFRTMDKLGPRATILTGMLGAVDGIPVIVSEQMLLADTDGKVTDAGNAEDRGRLLLFNRTQWAQGFRRLPAITTDRDQNRRQTVVYASLRHALTERSGSRSTAKHTALSYNIW